MNNRVLSGNKWGAKQRQDLCERQPWSIPVPLVAVRWAPFQVYHSSLWWALVGTVTSLLGFAAVRTAGLM